MVPVRRRDFIKLTSCFAASWPLAAHAQQTGRIRRIGVLMAHAESDPEFHARNWGGRKAATSESTLAGVRSTTRRRGNDLRKNWLSYNPKLFLHKTLLRR